MICRIVWEHPVEVGKWHGPAERRERAVLRDLGRCVQESSPRRTGQRAADADPPNARLGQRRDRGDIAPDEDVDRLGVTPRRSR
jgi:hypothetical protein